jgi:hypothetical protein
MCFRLFDEQTCLLRSDLALRRGMAFDVDESVDESDLQLDLFATQDRRAGQGRDLIEGARELLDGFDQRRPRQRSLSRFAPKVRGFLDHAGLGPVSRQQLRSALGAFREFALNGFGDASM